VPIATRCRVEFMATDGLLYLAFPDGASHQAARGAFEIVRGFLRECQGTPLVALDLDGCGWVDSTFAGWLIRLHRQLTPRGGCILLAQCPAGCWASLEIMGLSALFLTRAVPRPAERHTYDCPDEGADPATIRFVLGLHAGLAKLNDANQRTFAPLVAQLRQELAAAQKTRT
jgi:hypothetical protein